MFLFYPEKVDSMATMEAYAAFNLQDRTTWKTRLVAAIIIDEAMYIMHFVWSIIALN